MKTSKNILTEWFKKSLVLGGVLLFFASAGQVTKSNHDFKAWDADGDKKISKTEFSDRYADVDKEEGLTTDMQEGRLNENKFYESSYGVWDADKDNRLNEDEWRTGYDSSYGEYLEDDFSSYDANQNGYLEYEEYHNSLGESDYYTSWDKNSDSYLDDKEYSDMVFETWDSDGDDYIDENEFGEYNSKLTP